MLYYISILLYAIFIKKSCKIKQTRENICLCKVLRARTSFGHATDIFLRNF